MDESGEPAKPQIPTPQPQPTTFESKPHINSWFIWLGVVLAAVAGSFLLTYFVLLPRTVPHIPVSTPQVTVIPSPTPPPAGGPTANWKVYTNNDYKFTFSYPSSWKFEERASESSALTLLLSDTMQEGVSEEGAKNIWIDVNKITTSLDLYITRAEKPKYELVEDKIVGENTFKIVRGVGDPAYVPKSYLVENKGNLISIRNWNFETTIYEKFLSTFKFL